MPCYFPMEGFPSVQANANGKNPISFTRPAGYTGESISIPCGQCIGCRLERSRQWALRCVHESSLHEFNSFLTLTYRPEEIPVNGDLVKPDLQKFIKRLRKRLPGVQLRYFACGEYGESLENSLNGKLGHPHYHICLFGYDFPDKELWSRRNGFNYYRSPLLENLWPFGFSIIGDLTFETAAYTARYVCKKHLGKDSDFYDCVDDSTGEIFRLTPEFAVMSLKPGIGRGWFEKYHSDTDKDYLTLNGVKMSLPKYYDKLLEMDDEIEYSLRVQKRVEKASEKIGEDYFDRLRDGNKIKLKKATQLVRDL